MAIQILPTTPNKYMRTIVAALLALLSISVRAQIQTITVASNGVSSGGAPYVGGTLTVSNGYFACLKSLIGPDALLSVTAGSMTTTIGNDQLSLADTPFVVAGPATIQIQQLSNVSPGCFATLSVEPAPFPPGKTVTVGAYAGNVQVTMQISTDLVNWTPAVNGQVYTNSPDARFFRIQLVTNAGP